MGRAGRNGDQAHAILYHKVIRNKISVQTKQYGENKSLCCRELLLRIFSFITMKAVFVIVIAVICVLYYVLVMIVVLR